MLKEIGIINNSGLHNPVTRVDDSLDEVVSALDILVVQSFEKGR